MKTDTLAQKHLHIQTYSHNVTYMLKRCVIERCGLYCSVCLYVFASESLPGLYTCTCLHLSLSVDQPKCEPKTAHYPAFIAPQGGSIPFKDVISAA